MFVSSALTGRGEQVGLAKGEEPRREESAANHPPYPSCVRVCGVIVVEVGKIKNLFLSKTLSSSSLQLVFLFSLTFG